MLIFWYYLWTYIVFMLAVPGRVPLDTYDRFSAGQNVMSVAETNNVNIIL